MSTPESERDWKGESGRLEVEDELHRQYGIALGRYGFDACYNWDGKERCEKTIWNALVDSRLKLRAAERALQLALSKLAHKPQCLVCLPTSEWSERGSWAVDKCCCEISVVEAALAEIRRDGKVR